MNPYEVLGVERDANEKTIKSAYRKLSKAHHPDAGGERDTFERIKLAFDVLSSPERRKRYDTTGRIDISPITAVKIKEMIQTAVQGIINGPVSGRMDDPVWEDVRVRVLESIKGSRVQIQNNMANTQRKLERIQRLLERFKTKNEEDPVGDALRDERTKAEKELRQHDNAMELTQELEKVFNSYDYEVGPGPEGQFSPGPPLRRGTVFLSGSSKNPFSVR